LLGSRQFGPAWIALDVGVATGVGATFGGAEPPHPASATSAITEARAMIARAHPVRLARGSPIGILIQVIITGISIGAVYGLFGMCLSVLYRLTGVVHLALGELAGICVFTTLWVSYGQEAVAGTDARVPFVVGAVVGLAVAGVVGTVVYLAAVRPFIARGFSLGWIGGIVAAAIALRGLTALVFTRASYTLADPLPLRNIGNDGIINLSDGATLQARVLVVGVVALAIAAAATWLLDHSRAGSALRAISEDRIGASLCGVPVQRALLLAFGTAAVVVAAASLLALAGNPVTVSTGTLLGLKGLVAAAVARFGNPRRVFVAALAVGVLETTVATFHIGPIALGPAYSEVLPLLIGLIVMAVWTERTPLQEEA
jgi:branched-chain amino acid transport system permease protein